MSEAHAETSTGVESLPGGEASWSMARAVLAPCAEPVEIWASQGVLQHRSELVFPNGCVELVWNLDAPIRQRVGGRLSTLPDLSVSGVCLDAFELRHPHFHRTLGLRLPPEVAHRLLGRGAGELGPWIDDLRDLWPREACERLGRALRLDEAPSATPRALVERALGWLRTECAGGPMMSRRLRAALEGLRRGMSVAEVAAGVEVSHSQLTRSFKRALGVTPQRYAGVVRLNEACRRIAEGRPLVEVALDCGFSDQSHMTRAFGALAGVTPATFAEAHYALAVTMKI